MSDATLRGGRVTIVCLVLSVLLAIACVLSLIVGSYEIAPSELLRIARNVENSRSSPAAAVLWHSRVPRTLAGIIVGIAFGHAGALIQSLTRNPLADPGILGVNAGAGFGVSIAILVFGISSASGYIWFAFLGAVLAATAVYWIGTAAAGKPDPIIMTLAGVALAAILSGATAGISLMNREVFNSIRFWNVGGLQNRGFDVIGAGVPFIIVGVLLSIAVSRHLDSIALGDEVAKSLGTSLGWTRTAVVIAVTLLAGAATAIAGPIGFVGLMIPHAARALVGVNTLGVLAVTTVAAPLLLLISDVLGRVIVQGEMQVGIVTAFLGAPVLIMVARRSELSDL